MAEREFRDRLRIAEALKGLPVESLEKVTQALKQGGAGGGAGSSAEAIVAAVAKCMKTSMMPENANLSKGLREEFRAWASANPEDVKWKKNSGCGGSETYKVSLGGGA